MEINSLSVGFFDGDFPLHNPFYPETECKGVKNNRTRPFCFIKHSLLRKPFVYVILIIAPFHENVKVFREKLQNFPGG